MAIRSPERECARAGAPAHGGVHPQAARDIAVDRNETRLSRSCPGT